MFCTNCGTKLADGLNFCTNCGTRLQTVAEQPTLQQNPVQPLVQQAAQVPPQNNFVVPADKNAWKDAMLDAIKRGDIRAVEAILNAGYKVNQGYSYFSPVTPLGFAAMFDRADIARLLIQRGAAVKGMKANCGYEHSVLIVAVINNSLETAKILLDAGSDPNSSTTNGKTAMKIAEQKGFKEMKNLLALYGAKTNSAKTFLKKGNLVVNGLTGLAVDSRADAASISLLKTAW